jgi:hypothetical protein
MSETTKLTESELGRLQLLQKDTIEIVSALGELEYQKIIIQNQVDQLKKSAIETKQKEQDLLKELTEKYGTISINVETGEFTK